MRMPVFLNAHLAVRSDSACDYMDRKIADSKLIEYYLARGMWDGPKEALIGGKEVSYTKFFAETVLKRYLDGADFLKYRPDVLLMDSHFDQYTNLFRHKDGWRAFFGRIGFVDKEIEKEFIKSFKYIGRIDAKESARNVQRLSSYFHAKNPQIKIFYMHFPLLPGYLPTNVYKQDQMIRQEIDSISSKIPNFFALSIPISKVAPLTDTSHPNYSSEIWNHFYPEVYNFFADRIVEILKR